MRASVGQCKDERAILVVLEQVAGTGKGYPGLIGLRHIGQHDAVPPEPFGRCVFNI